MSFLQLFGVLAIPLCHARTIYRLVNVGNGKQPFLRLFHESRSTFPASHWRQIGFTIMMPSSIYPTYKYTNCNMLEYTRVQPTDPDSIQMMNMVHSFMEREKSTKLYCITEIWYNYLPYVWLYNRRKIVLICLYE